MQLDFDMTLVKGSGISVVEAKEAIPREESLKIESPTEDNVPSIGPVQALSNDQPQSDSCQGKTNNASRENVFVLPDLNMMAAEDEDSGSETMYGMSW